MDQAMKQKRWEEYTDTVTCRQCWGDGRDDDELDGTCLNCRGKGEYEVTKAFCNYCGNEDFHCDCDEIGGVK